MATKPARVRRTIAQIVLATQFWAPIAPAFAQSVPAITDEPLYTYSGVQANLMLTVDNSGSMDWQFAPMYTTSNKTQEVLHQHALQPALLRPGRDLHAAGQVRRLPLPGLDLHRGLARRLPHLRGHAQPLEPVPGDQQLRRHLARLGEP